MKKSITLIVFLTALLFGCTTQEEILTGSCPKYVELNYSNYDSLSTDPLSLISAKVEGDCLVMTLQYGGGCKEHQVDLALISPECGTPPLPPPAFEIRHNANGDVCKALITKEYSFDISGIKESGKTEITFTLSAKGSENKTLTYKY
jgi:hypothetical protein